MSTTLASIGIGWSRCFILISSLLMVHCAHDTYQERANLIKDHTESFYTHLKANHVESAIRENEQIEAMASEMGHNVQSLATRQGTATAEREFALMKTTKETAAANWLALGQFFAIKQQYPQARTTYQRVLKTFTSPTDRPYREQATRALQDLDILNPPTAATKTP